MSKKKSTKRNIIEWALLIGIPVIIYLAGWHTAVIGTIQGLFLETGVKNASLNIPADKQVDANYDLLLNSESEGIIKLEKFRGKVIIINFWATWCPPCRAEMPTLQDLYEDVDTSKIKFVIISTDRDPRVAEKFLQESDYNFPSFRIAGSIPSMYKANTIPTTFIISPGGKLVGKEVGMSNFDNDKFKEQLKDLISSIKTEM